MSLMGGRPAMGRTLDGVWYGVVASINGLQVWVTVPRVYGAAELGPCEMVEFPGTVGLLTDLAGGPAHQHGVRPAASALAVGDRVLVAFLEGRPSQPVIVGRMAGR